VKASGDAAEALALAHLTAHGCRLRDRNYRSRFGEIDLIVTDGDTLVFVEVRKRGNRAFASAAESITVAKQQRILATARLYLSRLPSEVPCRFDAVLIDAADRIEWIRDAFSA
jgi:putative endonuclease